MVPQNNASAARGRMPGWLRLLWLMLGFLPLTSIGFFLASGAEARRDGLPVEDAVVRQSIGILAGGLGLTFFLLLAALFFTFFWFMRDESWIRKLERPGRSG